MSDNPFTYLAELADTTAEFCRVARDRELDPDTRDDLLIQGELHANEIAAHLRILNTH